MMKEKSIPCPCCSGAGQVNFFKGESRFLLSSEECPECSGLGVIFPEEAEREEDKDTED